MIRSRSFLTAARSGAALALLIGLASAAGAVDLPPFAAPPVPLLGDGGGYRVERWPVPPRPNRFDIYGYPVFGPRVSAAPDPRLLGNGCPVALQPIYDVEGNAAGYAPVQFCR